MCACVTLARFCSLSSARSLRGSLALALVQACAHALARLLVLSLHVPLSLSRALSLALSRSFSHTHTRVAPVQLFLETNPCQLPPLFHTLGCGVKVSFHKHECSQTSGRRASFSFALYYVKSFHKFSASCGSFIIFLTSWVHLSCALVVQFTSHFLYLSYCTSMVWDMHYGMPNLKG